MNWSLIPEIFFDLIARIVPGSLFLVGAFAVHFGPKTFVKEVASALPSANLAFVLLFGLLAYFVAIVLKEIWEFCAWIARGTIRGADSSDPFLAIRSRMPAEASRLLKLQAEKNICEVLVPGLVILFVGNFWMAAANSSGDLKERVALGSVLLISGVACWRWRKGLELFYLQGLASLQRLSEEAKAKQRDEPVL